MAPKYKQSLPLRGKTKNYVFAVGRRRSAIARVRLFKGEEENTVNGQVVGKYFQGDTFGFAWNKPFEVTETLGKYYFTARVVGGGKNGQLDAIVLGISRTLVKMKDGAEQRKVLKKAGLMTRDSRIRERRKMGMGGKARRKKQSPKR